MFKSKTLDKWGKIIFFQKIFLIVFSISFIFSYAILFMFLDSVFVIRNFYYLLLVPAIIVPITIIISSFYKTNWLNKKIDKEIIASVNENISRKKIKIICIFVINQQFDQNNILLNMKQTYKNVNFYVLDLINNKEVKIFCNNKKIMYCNNIESILRSEYDFLALVNGKIESNYIQNNLNLFYSEKMIRLGYIEDNDKNIFLRKEIFQYANNDYLKIMNNIKKESKKYLWFGINYPW